MSYATDHADALAVIGDAGTGVTFTSVTETYDAATDVVSVSADGTVAGKAVRVKGDPKRYEALGLVIGESVTLLFAPTTFAANPALGSTVTWGSSVYTVRDVEPVAPDGNTIISHVIVSL